MSIDLLPEFIKENYEIHEWKHACAILREDFPDEWNDIVSLLDTFRLWYFKISLFGGLDGRLR